MKRTSDSVEPYRKLVRARNWEIPVPGREAVVGFLVVLGVSLFLHGFLLWLCSVFRN